MKKLDYHDASINKIEHQFDDRRLVIGVRLYDSTRYDLIFDEVLVWDFSPFEFQNFLLDLKIYDFEHLPNAIVENYEIPPKYIALLKSEKARLFELDPATGMGGYIIAKEISALMHS